MSESLTLQQLKDVKKLASELGAESCNDVSGATATLSVPNTAFNVDYPTQTLQFVEQGALSRQRKDLAVSLGTELSHDSMSRDGSMFVVGFKDWSNETGYIRVYERGVDGNFGEPIYVNDSPLGPSSLFGSATAMNADGSWFVVGAPRFSTYQGAVCIYNRTINGNSYSLHDTIQGTSNSSQFGKSVAMSADGLTIVVGAPQYNEERGAVEVYKLISDTWTKQDFHGNTDKRMTGENSTSDGQGSKLGHRVSVSADGNTFAVLSQAHNSNKKGAVHVYTLNSNNKYELVGSRIDGIQVNSWMEKVSLSADGTVVALGIPGWNPGTNINTYHGSVQVYKWSHDTDFLNANGAWESRASLQGAAAQHYFGHSVALSADGSVLAVGAHGVKTDEGFSSANGQVRIYEWNNGNYVERLEMGGQTENKAFGVAISMSSDGKEIIIGKATNVTSYQVDLFSLMNVTYPLVPQPLQHAIGDLVERLEALESQ